MNKDFDHHFDLFLEELRSRIFTTQALNHPNQELPEIGVDRDIYLTTYSQSTRVRYLRIWARMRVPGLTRRSQKGDDEYFRPSVVGFVARDTGNIHAMASWDTPRSWKYGNIFDEDHGASMITDIGRIQCTSEEMYRRAEAMNHPASNFNPNL